MSMSSDTHANYLAARSTLNRIHAQAMEASKTHPEMQAINHHLMSAQFHLQEMQQAQQHGMEDHHELAREAFQKHIGEAGKHLHYVHSAATDQLAGDVDQLHLDSYALKYE